MGGNEGEDVREDFVWLFICLVTESDIGPHINVLAKKFTTFVPRSIRPTVWGGKEADELSSVSLSVSVFTRIKGRNFKYGERPPVVVT